ncbi:MAG: aminotransferase, partial [Caldilinea sp.]|nr:aminotransferase [Caldilinea sp.]
AIAFQAEHDWPAVRGACHALLAASLDRLAAITGMAPVYTRPDGYAQMAIAPLPPQPDLAAFKERLYDDYAVEIPCPAWQGRHFLRISVQGYNSEADLRRLEDAVQTLLVPAQ